MRNTAVAFHRVDGLNAHTSTTTDETRTTAVREPKQYPLMKAQSFWLIESLQ